MSGNSVMNAKTGKHKSFYENAFWQFGLQIVKYLFPLIVLPYLTRILSPEGYGIYAYVVSFMILVRVFVEYGFNLSGTKQIAEAKSIKEKNCILGAITQARVFLSALAGVVVWLIASSIPLLNGYLIYTMFAYFAICITALAPDYVFQGHERMRSLTTRYLVSKSISTLLTFAVVHSVDDMLWIPILDILSSSIALAWSFLAAKKEFGVTISLVGIGRCIVELKNSGLYCFSNVASAALTSFTTLFVGIVIPEADQVAYWSVATTAVAAVTSLYTPILNSLYPHLINTRDFTFGIKLILASFPIVVVVTALLAALSGLVMTVLGGLEYVAGATILSMISPVVFFSFFSMLLGWPILGAAGKVKEITGTTIISALFSISALGVLVCTNTVSMTAICVIRVFAEAILFGTRLFECFKTKKKGGFELDDETLSTLRGRQ